MFRRVAVGISGGVDSAVSALLLKQKGFDVIGVFMKNWDEAEEVGQCSGEKDWYDAQIVCKRLNVPLKQVNFVKNYWNDVFLNFLEDYETGLTPNPDILCNKFIKFDKFFNYAKNTLNADAIATGHYAQSSFDSYLENFKVDEDAKLLKAVDSFKDQTFFLSSIKQSTLRYAMFPIGTLKKSEVKELASKHNLNELAKKRESTGICFIGQRNFKSFINEYLPKKIGNFVDVDTNIVVGQHDGIHNWTVGQRCRLASHIKPYFVAFKEHSTNTIFVASGTDHPILYSQQIIVDEPHWINSKTNHHFENFTFLNCEFRFQHTKPLVSCKIMKNSNSSYSKWIVRLDTPLRALTPGQYAVFYFNNECLGLARILCPLINKEKIRSNQKLESSQKM